MIKLNGVTKCYGSQTALKGISLEIGDGQVIGVLGENGAGKTTLLKALAGLTALDDGEITYFDINTVKERSEKIAFMTEEGTFFPFMTAKENALFLADYYPKFNMERFEKLCAFLVIPTDKKARAFSKGQKAKLEIALGFSKGAKYLLIDEPFLGNDIFTRCNFLKLMCDSLITDETIVIATHMVDEIENIIDRALLLENGHLIRDVIIEDMQANRQSLEELMKEAFHYDEDRFKNMFYNG